MVETVSKEWPFPWQGIVTELDSRHIPPDGLTECENMYYPSQGVLRSRGSIDSEHSTAGGNITTIYYWDCDSNVYFGDASGNFYKNTTSISGPAENISDMGSFGVTDTPKLIVAEEKGAQDHTLHTYDGSSYAKLTGTAIPNPEKVTTRLARVFGTCDPDYPSRVWFSDENDETLWRGAWGRGGFVDIAPGHDGDIVDWVEHKDTLYIFKSRGIYRLVGLRPTNFKVEKVAGVDGVLDGSVVDAQRGILYATDTGVWPVGEVSGEEKADLARNAEADILSFLSSGVDAAYSPEMGAYIMVNGTTTAWVSNHANRPDVWTKLTLPDACYSVYQGDKLYFGADAGELYAYDHDGYQDDGAAYTVKFKTGDWDFNDRYVSKNVRVLIGAFNAARKATATVKFYEDASGTATSAAEQSITSSSKNMFFVNLDVNRLAVETSYSSLTGPCMFGGFSVRIAPGKAIV